MAKSQINKCLINVSLVLVLILSVRVAGQACIAIVLVAADFIMIFVGLPLLMTGETGKDAIIIWVGVAITALIPFSFVFAAVNRKVLIVMIPCRRHPCGLRVTGLAVCRKLGCLVVRIIGLVIIVLVAAITRVWRVVVGSIMAFHALIGYRSMSPH